MNEDRFRGQDPDDLYSSREEDEYATGDEMTSSMGERGSDEPPMRQEQGGQGYGRGPQGQQDEAGFDTDDMSSDMGEGVHGRRTRRQSEDDELYGNQLDDLHDQDDDDRGGNW